MDKKKKIRVNPKKVDIEKLISQENIKLFREYMSSDQSDMYKWGLFHQMFDIAISSIDFRLMPLGRKEKIYLKLDIALREFFSDCLPKKSVAK